MKTIQRFGSALLVICFAGSAITLAQSAGFNRQVGTSYTAGTPILRFYRMKDAFPGQCEADCARDAACMAYTYIRPGGYNAGDPPMCYLFSQAGYTANNDCCTSGHRTAQPTQTGTPSSRSLEGTWLFRGMAGQNCTITARPGEYRLAVTTERGNTGDGYLAADGVIDVFFPRENRLRGQLSPDGSRITWANGEIWTRSPMTAAGGGSSSGGGGTTGGRTPGGGTQTSTCDDIKGVWFQRLGNSGAHIYVYHESFPPGSWAMGGGEVNPNFSGHNDRWGPVVCLGNNRFEFRRTAGNPFLVATLRDGKLVQDDGTHWSH